MKKISFLLCSIVLCATMGTATAQSGGTIGNLQWEIVDSTLTITGVGAMPDYNNYNNLSPWYSQRESISSVVIGDSVTSIGDYAFWNCLGLVSVTIPYSVTTIGRDAFYGCSGLTSVTIPNSVTSIGYTAFTDCSGLTSIEVATDNPSYSSENGVLFNKDRTMLIAYPGGKNGAYVIPNPVTVIGNAAFSLCKDLTSIAIPNSVITIGHYAFQSSYNLASVTIGNSVITIGDYAFSNCTGLTSVTIPNSVITIGDDAFSNCTGLTSVTIPNSVTAIGENVFFSCSSMISIEVVLSNPSYSSENGVLFNKDKTTLIAYPAGKTETAYIIPNSVTTIDYGAFNWCLGLTSVTIPKSVDSIKDLAFMHCESLIEITNLATTPQELYAVFLFVNRAACTLRVPANSMEAYRTADVWKEFLIESITSNISSSTFAGITVYGSGSSICITNSSGTALNEIVITDMQGRIVYSDKGRKYSTPTETIPINSGSGIYIVKLVSDDGKTLSTKVHLFEL